MKRETEIERSRSTSKIYGAVAICLTIATATIPVAAFASGAELPRALAERNVSSAAEGVFSANENARWALGNDGTLAVRGSGAISADDALYDVSNQIKHIFIGKDISGIDAEAFSFFVGLESIELESGSILSQIGSYAFAGCRSLGYVSLPSTVTQIGEAAFLDCENMRQISFGDSSALESIGASAFANCKKLSGIELPKSLKEISNYAFNGCSSLDEITIPANVSSVGEEAFGNCEKLGNVTVENPSGTSIDDFAFAGQTASKPATIAIKDIKVGKRSIKVKWSKVRGCRKYQIFYKQKGGKKLRSITVRSSTSKVIKNLKKNRRYQVYVTAQKDGNTLCKSTPKTSKKVS